CGGQGGDGCASAGADLHEVGPPGAGAAQRAVGHQGLLVAAAVGGDVQVSGVGLVVGRERGHGVLLRVRFTSGARPGPGDAPGGRFPRPLLPPSGTRGPYSSSSFFSSFWSSSSFLSSELGPGMFPQSGESGYTRSHP